MSGTRVPCAFLSPAFLGCCLFTAQWVQVLAISSYPPERGYLRKMNHHFRQSEWHTPGSKRKKNEIKAVLFWFHWSFSQVIFFFSFYFGFYLQSQVGLMGFGWILSMPLFKGKISLYNDDDSNKFLFTVLLL